MNLFDYVCPLGKGIYVRDMRLGGHNPPTWWPRWTRLCLEGISGNPDPEELDAGNYTILASRTFVFNLQPKFGYFSRTSSLHDKCTSKKFPRSPCIVKVEWDDLDIGRFIFGQLNLKGVLIKMNVGKFLENIGKKVLEEASHYVCRTIGVFLEEYSDLDFDKMNAIAKDLDGLHVGYIKNYAKPIEGFIYRIYVQCMIPFNEKKIRLIKSCIPGYPDFYVDEYTYSIYKPDKLDIQAYIYFSLLSKFTIGNGDLFGTSIGYFANRLPYLECNSGENNKGLFSRHLQAHLVAWGMYPENISFQILVRYLVDKNILLEYDNYRPDWKKLIQDINPKDREKVLEKLEFLNDILER